MSYNKYIKKQNYESIYNLLISNNLYNNIEYDEDEINILYEYRDLNNLLIHDRNNIIENKQNLHKKYNQFVNLRLSKNKNFTLEYKYYFYIKYKYGNVYYINNNYKYGNENEAFENKNWTYLSKNITEELPDKLDELFWLENSIIWNILSKINIYLNKL